MRTRVQEIDRLLTSAISSLQREGDAISKALSNIRDESHDIGRVVLEQARHEMELLRARIDALEKNHEPIASHRADPTHAAGH